MKYLVRSIKYYLYLLIILCVIIAVLVLTGIVESDISQMFVNGYDSLWQMALLIAVFAAIYPRFGYTSRMVHLPGSSEEIRPDVVSKMTALGYVVESEDAAAKDGTEPAKDGTEPAGEDICFRRRTALSRALKFWEDRITFTRVASGFEVEGITKDVVRIMNLFTDNF